MKRAVYFIDLTHESGLGLGSDHMPLQIGLIAAYLLQELPDDVDVRLFKFVRDLERAVAERPPWILAASNYMWNIDLEYKIASAVKAAHPETILVFGGPNYPSEPDEQAEWLYRYPNVDIYIYRDGEIPLARLAKTLLDRSLEDVKKMRLPSCHALVDGAFYAGPLELRVRDLDIIPSPYSMGLMDQFFECNLVPSIQTNRGCPFTCTFCVEGEGYYTKVFTVSHERKCADVDYILAQVMKTRRTGTLRIVDSNFGMFLADVRFCEYLAEIQRRTGYPDFISCSTGKNQKERILQCAALLGSAMRLTASVQSLDAGVLQTIKRKNISFEEMLSMSEKTSDTEGHAYSEIILGLPGDSLRAEEENIRGLIAAGINNITQHQCALLYGTEAASPASRAQFGLHGMFRPIQRCVGKYPFNSREIIAIDVEEIAVSSNTLSFDDYLEARRLYLTVGLFYNDRIFAEILALLALLKISPYEWLRIIHDGRIEAPEGIRSLYEGYIHDTKAELWDDPVTLTRDVGAHIDRFIEGAEGGNIIYKYRSRSLIEYFRDLHDEAYKALRAVLTLHGIECEGLVQDLSRFSLLQKNNMLLGTDEVREAVFRHDVVRLIRDHAFQKTGAFADLRREIRVRFAHTERQREDIKNRIAFYSAGGGVTVHALTMLMSRYPVKRFYRKAEYVETAPVAEPVTQSVTSSQ